MLGALGVTVGALLAAVLPSTRAEDELMGDIRDDLRDRALDAGGAVLERGARVAGDVMDAATGAAEREGLTAEGAQGAAAQARSGITDMAQRVQHVVEEGAAAARKATEREFAGESLEEDGPKAAFTKGPSSSSGVTSPSSRPAGETAPNVGSTTSPANGPVAPSASGTPDRYIGSTPSAFDRGERNSRSPAAARR